MKKICAFILVISMLLSNVPALAADDFTLRNGIMFGDSMDEVLAKETLEIAEIGDSDSEKYAYIIKTKSGTVAGISDTDVYYHFDSNKELKEVEFCFPRCYSKNSGDYYYETLNEGLIRKYGAPLGYSNGSCYAVIGGALQYAISVSFMCKLANYDEWDIKLDNYHVKIELIEGRYSSTSYVNRISYTYFTDDELHAQIDADQEFQDAVDNDL